MFDPSKLNINLEDENNEASTKQNKEKKSNALDMPETKSESSITEDTTLEKKETEDVLSDAKVDINETNVELKDTETETEVEAEVETEEQDKENETVTNEEETSNSNETDATQKVEENTEIETKTEEEKVIFDINITSISELIKYSVRKDFDYFIVEALEDKGKITLRKEGHADEIKFVRFPTYTEILLKAKTLTKLKADVTDKEQEGKGEVKLNGVIYKAKSKTVISPFGEKMFFKLEATQEHAKKEVKKTSINQILGLMAAGLFSLLLISGAYLSFILFNSNSVSDLTFFNNLGVDAGSIKEFIAKLVDIVFLSIIFIETVFLFIFSFKAILTKKEYKKEKVSKIIVSMVLFILMFVTASLWIALSDKINTLKGINYGKIEFYDNGRYLSSMYTPEGAKISANESIIGPISVRINIKEFMKKLQDDGFTSKKVIWMFEDEEIEKPIGDFEIIREFDKKGLHDIKLKVEGTNIKGEPDAREKDVASFNIQHIVEINEKIEKSGGKRIDFDASSLRSLGKINWYYIEKSNANQELKSVFSGYKFHPGRTIFDEVLIGMSIGENKENSGILDQIFVISGVQENNIKGTISYEENIKNDLEYTIRVDDAETDFGAGFIEQYKWKIGNKIFTKFSDDSSVKNPSEITYEFKNYGEHYIEVELMDSTGNTKTISTTIKIDKKLKFKEGNTLKIYSDGKQITDYKFEEKAREYYIDDLGAPAKLKIDANSIRSEDFLYTLEAVEWDTDNDGNTDETGKVLNYDIHTGGNYTIAIKFTFKNKRKDERIYINEKIYITSEKKEAILDLQMNYSSDYTPVMVAFDASKSEVKGKNISKFIYDYGDGSPLDERDAKNPGHKYIKPGEYDVKLTVVTTDGTRYSISKKLILKPEPQKAEILASRKTVSIFDGIDFSSENSVGQITNYFWDFGDNNTSIEANPTHFYKKPGKYKVKLIIDFKNRNSLSDEIEINVTD